MSVTGLSRSSGGRLLESLVVWEVEVDRGLQRLRRLDAALEGSELVLGRTCQRLQAAAAP